MTIQTRNYASDFASTFTVTYGTYGIVRAIMLVARKCVHRSERRWYPIVKRGHSWMRLSVRDHLLNAKTFVPASILDVRLSRYVCEQSPREWESFPMSSCTAVIFMVMWICSSVILASNTGMDGKPERKIHNATHSTISSVRREYEP